MTIPLPTPGGDAYAAGIYLSPYVPPTLDVSFRYDFHEIEDGAGAQVAVLDLQHNTYGTWQAAYDVHHPVGQMLLSALISGEDLDHWGAVFRLPGSEQIIASGPVTTIIAADGRRNGLSDDAISVYGVTDMAYLSDRICFPLESIDIPLTADTGPGHTWGSYRKYRKDPVETVILEFIDGALGSTARPRRQLGAGITPQTTFVVPASLGRGPTVFTAPTANDSVQSVIDNIAGLAGLSFDIRQSGPGEVTVYVVENQTREGIVWAPSGAYGEDAGSGPATANGLTVKRQRSKATSVIASGYGNDTSVVYVRRDATAPSLGVPTIREEFIKGAVEGTTTDDVEILVDEADAELEEDSGELGLDLEPSPLAPWHLGVDYELGDNVIGVIYGEDVEAPIRRVVFTHSDGAITESITAEWAEDLLGPVVRDLYRRLDRTTRRT